MAVQLPADTRSQLGEVRMKTASVDKRDFLVYGPLSDHFGKGRTRLSEKNG